MYRFGTIIFPYWYIVKIKCTVTESLCAYSVILYVPVRYYNITVEVILLNLKKVRLDKNMTQKDVADRLGCTPNIYSRYETGERQPSIDTLIRLSQIFEKSIDYLVENHAEVDLSISKEEQELLQAYRNADDRAREDALNTLLSHPLEKKKEKLA